MAFQFRLPDIGEGIHEGEIVKWFVKPGDEVQEDDVLCEVQNDKAVVEIPSPVKGKVEEIGVYETMRKLNDLGFGAVEVSQIPMTAENVSELKRASKDFSINIAALSAGLEPAYPGAPGETLTTDFEKIVNDCKTLDCTFVRIGMLPFTVIGHKDKIMEFVKKADAVAEKLAKHGIDLYYHNHHIEFQKYDGEYLLPEFKHLDYLWLSKGDLPDSEGEKALISDVRSIPGVQLVIELNNEKIRNKQHLIF